MKWHFEDSKSQYEAHFSCQFYFLFVVYCCRMTSAVVVSTFLQYNFIGCICICLCLSLQVSVCVLFMKPTIINYLTKASTTRFARRMCLYLIVLTDNTRTWCTPM